MKLPLYPSIRKKAMKMTTILNYLFGTLPLGFPLDRGGLSAKSFLKRIYFQCIKDVLFRKRILFQACGM